MLLLALTIIFNIHQVLLMHPLSKEFIKFINDGNYLWNATQNFPETADLNVIQNLMGSNLDDKGYKVVPNIEYALDPGEYIPMSFDSRIRWPNCSSLREISEQGSCASCWAVSATDIMTDRYCIFSNQTLQNQFAAFNIVSCCINWGCSHGGEISVAWRYWLMFGVVSGGPYDSKHGCQPNKMPPCDFHKNCNETIDSPICEHKCQGGYNISYKADKKFAERIYTIRGGERQMQMAIMKNGPVQSVMSVYEDFLSYKSGVYYYVIGKMCGGHAVRLLGWGEENGLPYWIAANSWGTRWGDNGFFKILRGRDHCDIESTVMAGEPKIADDMKKNLRVKFDDRVHVQFQWSTEI